MLALSVRQPHAELMMLGVKTVEYRSQPTLIRGRRVYIYASLYCGPAIAASGLATGADLQSLPRGKIIGTIEIYGCSFNGEDYEWHLRAPRRLKRPRRPARRANPVWFRPW